MKWRRSFGVAAVAASCLLPWVGVAAGANGEAPRVVKAGGDTLTVDGKAHELRISAVVTRDASKPSVADWGKRGAAWFGCKGGKAEAFFIFTTAVDRPAIDRGLRELGAASRRQITDKEYKGHTGLKPETKPDDYLDGDPILIGIRYKKAGQTVQFPLEYFIQEKILVGGKEVVKPYTPHWIYHGTAEAIAYPSGCVSCPEDCYGGIIADNAVPVLTLDRWYKVDWEKMPPPGTAVEIILRTL